MKHVLICGAVGGLLIAALRLTEYRFLVIEHNVALYGALTALTFAVLGIWLGARLLRRPPTEAVAPVATQPFVPNQQERDALGLTPRELEILELIARGLSNREMAESLHVSENTIKTHCSRVFDKLGAKRRTQAVQMSKQLGLLP